ncbi:predicted protein [Naegleria gruberi]|uniref:Predicted protein n=1 Tax=Naegleria gruberi TaxID=5762 RepID=D2VGF1_NAEGR|nr:uncharacterized protein NAEGRDRAFT_67954 [Naegleria gruberi]EFC43957.1 predicted protein [Naegleria gruberi]|eukprot:XP_002676701.1 predicted protein [Naegleria gruberi strain NEG-M]
MDINEFKRKYSNESDTKAVMEWAFEKIAAAPETYSFWLAEYNQPDLLTGPAWMQNNLVEGYFRNIEGLKKNCFASALVLTNDEGAQRISMVWLVPTQTVPKEFTSDDIAGSKIGDGFNLTQLKPAESEEDKTTIINYMIWNEDKGAFGGYTYASGKIFK